MYMHMYMYESLDCVCGHNLSIPSPAARSWGGPVLHWLPRKREIVVVYYALV